MKLKPEAEIEQGDSRQVSFKNEAVDEVINLNTWHVCYSKTKFSRKSYVPIQQLITLYVIRRRNFPEKVTCQPSR